MPDVAKTYCAHSRPIPIRDQCQLQVGWARLARAVRIPPTMSWDFSRSNARGRSDLHSPNDAWTSQAHESPGMLQDRRGMSAASSPFRQDGVSRLAATCRSGIRQQIDGLGWPRETLCINTRDLRDNARVPPSGWPAGPDIPPGERRWGSEANSEAAGGKSGWRWSLGMGPSGRAAGTYGARFDGSHRGPGNGGCCEVGKAAGVLFDAAARDDQHG